MCVCPMLRIISPQKAAHNEILVKRQQVNFLMCVFVLCWQLFLHKRLHTMRYWCPMLRIVSPQKAAHNEILIKRQQVNFDVCVCPMLRIISPQKACTQWDIGEKLS